MNYISEKFAKIRGNMAQKSTLKLHLLHGGIHTFEMTPKEIEKTVMALENVEMQWLLIRSIRIRPSAILCIEIE